LRPHCAALLKTAVAAQSRAPSLFAPTDAARVIEWRNNATGRSNAGSLSYVDSSLLNVVVATRFYYWGIDFVSTVQGQVKAARASHASKHANSYETLQNRWASSECSGRGSIDR
jgi:hypothetical protein